MHIVVVCGTNREGALSRLLSQEAAEAYRERGHEVDLVDMAELARSASARRAYEEKSPEVQALVERFLKSEGVVFVIPEYNGSYPGVLKLFIDMLPFPEGFDGRPCALIGLAAGQFKSLRAVNTSSRWPDIATPTSIRGGSSLATASSSSSMASSQTTSYRNAFANRRRNS